MSGNTTDEYDYSSYYDGGMDAFQPCDSGNVSSFGKVFVPTLYSLVCIFGFIGNGLVVCVLVKHRNKTNLTDICLFNLALSDLIFVFTLSFYTHFIVVSDWVFGDFMCRFLAICSETGFLSSIFFMIVMTLDRYVVILHALTVAKYRTLRAGIILTVCVWMLSFTISLPELIFTKLGNDTGSNHCFYSPENQAWKLYSLVVKNILGLVIPLLVMVTCYSRIIPRLVNMRSAKKHRIVRLIIFIVVAFFLFWTPYNICLFLKYLYNQGSCTLQENFALAVTVTETFAFTHCCLNPVIYAFVGQKFTKRVLQMVTAWVPGCHWVSARGLSDSSYRKSSISSRSTDVTPTFIK
ncbi:uncharacterized protein V6R79_005534 [Siganus canaliculatus]